MKELSINFDDDLFVEIEKRTTADFDHSDVVQKLLRRALTSAPATGRAAPKPSPPSAIPAAVNGSIVSFVQTPEYRVLSAINKYLTVLGWVNKNRPTEFLKILDFRRGDRLYFGKSQRQVEDSGEGINAKQIPGSDIWAMSTLDNRTKRNLLADLLSLFGFHAGEINVVVDSIPDSGRHRGQGRLSSYLDAKP